MKLDSRTALPDYHAFPRIVDNYAQYGQKQVLLGGDNISRLEIRLPGGYQGKEGFFEWIIEPNQEVNHRLFTQK